MRVVKFDGHPQPIAGRSYWAVLEDEQPILAVFSVGDGNALVEGLITPAIHDAIMSWLAEAMTALEWQAIAISMMLTHDTVQHCAPAPKAMAAQRKPARRVKRRPSISRFLQKH